MDNQGISNTILGVGLELVSLLLPMVKESGLRAYVRLGKYLMRLGRKSMTSKVIQFAVYE